MIGRLVAKCIVDDLPFPVYLSRSFLKHILSTNILNYQNLDLKKKIFIDKTLYMNDIDDIDGDLWKNLNWVLENTVEDCDFTFKLFLIHKKK